MSKDLEFMQTSDEWPAFPLLPLKKGSLCGCLVAGEGPKIYRSNMFMFDWECETVSYDSFQAILDDDWRVD